MAIEGECVTDNGHKLPNSLDHEIAKWLLGQESQLRTQVNEPLAERYAVLGNETCIAQTAICPDTHKLPDTVAPFWNEATVSVTRPDPQRARPLALAQSTAPETKAREFLADHDHPARLMLANAPAQIKCDDTDTRLADINQDSSAPAAPKAAVQ